MMLKTGDSGKSVYLNLLFSVKNLSNSMSCLSGIQALDQAGEYIYE